MQTVFSPSGLVRSNVCATWHKRCQFCISRGASNEDRHSPQASECVAVLAMLDVVFLVVGSHWRPHNSHVVAHPFRFVPFKVRTAARQTACKVGQDLVGRIGCFANLRWFELSELRVCFVHEGFWYTSLLLADNGRKLDFVLGKRGVVDGMQWFLCGFCF